MNHNDTLQVYFDSTQKLHHGFDSSFECTNRIDKTIARGSDFCIDTADKCNHINLPQEWKNIIKNIEVIYNNIDSINCITCSFKNSDTNAVCDMCESKIDTTVKLISPIEGDTTYMCDTSKETLSNLLKSIIYCLQLQHKNKNDIFILSRPPGHHSDNKTPQGFCLINNMYFVVDYLKHLNHRYKICIIDWDVHHGNGTQSLFYNRDDILFIDLHRDNFYPHTGAAMETGEGKGKGFTINIPLKEGSDESVYINAFNTIIIPALEKFNPDWIAVSCGFDAHVDDPLGGMKLKSSSYGKFHRILQKLGKPITYMLEGGYNDSTIYSSIQKMIIPINTD